MCFAILVMATMLFPYRQHDVKSIKMFKPSPLQQMLNQKLLKFQEVSNLISLNLCVCVYNV